MPARIINPLWKIIRNVPWRSIANNGPVLVEGASKLFNSVRRGTASTPQLEAAAHIVAGPTSFDVAISGVTVRVESLEQHVAELHEEALASSQLLKSLAEQNNELVKAIQAFRAQTRMIFIVGGALLVALVVAGWLHPHVG